MRPPGAPDFDAADQKITAAAFDTTILRERLAPIYCFAPPEPGDRDFMARLGLEYAPVLVDPVFINFADNLGE